MELHNFMEKEVLNTIDRLLKDRPDICHCEKCRMDIAAIALNNLKPKYVVTEKGEAYIKVSELEVQFEVDILKEVIKAIEKVSKEPHHE
ncbi:late competence development ComFB family protein [Caldisalinibacter kiritimatiensis]|uniref:Competence protein ComFB n=1 Tax=Caldisalinibacter kiritimatiensis TaxID=1304284 RepID=R1AY00_9FIRM|nr:late competence development ComFB family protein [Caldisalinibacter kiritimatiensis]EOD01527.1 hypothetical protein L21TH_0410 [Caldisalinibacter kiritimatiensis]